MTRSCSRIHKERQDWTRFSRGTSETFRALNNLVDKGVKVRADTVPRLRPFHKKS